MVTYEHAHEEMEARKGEMNLDLHAQAGNGATSGWLKPTRWPLGCTACMGETRKRPGM